MRSIPGRTSVSQEPARKLKEKDPLCQLVFLTSRDELAYKTYEYDLNVLDYIIKCPEYFLQNGIHARLKERLDRIFAKLERMPMAESHDRKEIIVDSGSRQIHLDLENILYVQAVKQTHQLEIVAKEQKITARATLKEMYGRLGAGFIYINRSCIVARNKIMEIDNAIEEFINFVRVEREYSEHSVTAYAKDLSELSIYAHDEKVPDDVKSLDFFTLRGFITTLYDRELSKSSIERKISTIKSFFKFLYRRGFIEENPARMLKFPKKEKYLPTVFNVDDIFTLLDLPDKTTPMGMRDALILELLYGTGVRVSELVGLDRSAVDLNGMRILVRGKGKKERIVPLAPELISLIRNYYKVMYDIVADNRIVDSDALIINRLGTRMTDRTVRRVVEAYLKKAGLPLDYSPHSFRHTFATHLLEGGADLRSIQELLGHENLSTTQIYTHITVDKLKNVIQNAHPRAKKPLF